MEVFFLGIDVGTQGVRVVLMNQDGQVKAAAEKRFELTAVSREEQSPELWWESCLSCLNDIVISAGKNIDTKNVLSVSVTSTSGTVIPLDRENNVLHNALMYSDIRSEAEGEICKKAALQFNPEGYAGFNASSGLSKIVWFVKNFPDKAMQLATWVHATDFIIGKLCGNFRITDYTNALKSGFDVSRGLWPPYIHEHLPVKKAWLQEVVPSGTVIGTLLPELAEKLRLPALKVVSGMTDGCASQVASGAVNPGDWNTTIGTTLVVKGVTVKEINDPLGRLYSHRHPEGYWMPGGASNTGADWITAGFSENLAELNEAAAQLIPTLESAYPLVQQGERFPFISNEARGFAPGGISRETLFAANMEGVAYIERIAYELIETLSKEKVRAIFTAGGASNSDTWLTIRANVLNKPVYKCGQISGAAGAAILAASATHYQTLREAAKAMTHMEKVVKPAAGLVEKYEIGYQNFLKELRKRNYFQESVLTQ
ncbi:FGGY-family carbohydrate kinase [Dyadobacter psychrophilus]|uniref:Sugar (Pentulose or hexulose) kinase n=1 Tax=Dyadobacter psychrophilus TaxID=651661 RepID=A0A1T5EDA8_9BACT|nr:FGGY-family carbohydrate kinase [Dyadobacter psychrophilus]SKB82002.1 Sugar (pentulose or hexulose) kinase [Dyadobacter psychrophilus]